MVVNDRTQKLGVVIIDRYKNLIVICGEGQNQRWAGIIEMEMEVVVNDRIMKLEVNINDRHRNHEVDIIDGAQDVEVVVNDRT